MKNTIYSLGVLAWLLCVCSTDAQAKSSVWEVEKDGKKLYLGGTVHVLSEKDYPLPCEFNQAYQEAQTVVLETDISQLTSPQGASEVQQAIMYPSGQSLADTLSPETMAQLTAYLSTIGIPLEPILQMRPGGVLMTIMSIEMLRSGINAKGVDDFYQDAANNDKKALRYLESADHQLALIAQMGEGNEDKFVQYTIESLEDFSSQFEKLIQTWRSGDINGLQVVSEMDAMKTEFPKVFESLIVTRNNAWMSQIETMLTDDEIEYVLVGALHMVDNVGLLAQLRDNGYTVKPVEGCSVNP